VTYPTRKPLLPLPETIDGGTDTETVELALQGGGAHGAFTWGVLAGRARRSAPVRTAAR
jgi:predicted acylesterase/phospholipase RssA